MKRISGIAAAAVAGFLIGTLPAAAQYSNEFSPAKLLKQGKTSVDIAGTGMVVVQVQVNADGSHKAIKVIKSTNQGDNGAAMDIAQNSSYRPAHRGTTPVTAFYDFTLKFNGKSVANAESDSGGGGGGSGSDSSLSPAAQSVAALIRQKNYSGAKSRAQADLISAPDDQSLRQMLGVAAFDSGDVSTAAAAFDKVPTIGKQFQPAAAASFAAASVAAVDQNPQQALAYAQKAVALNPDANSRFALGTAQLANKQFADAVTTLKAVRASAMNDPKLSKSAKVNIDARLMSAYLATGDSQSAATIASEIKQLDPTSTLPGRVLGNTYWKMGVDAATALKYDDAFKYYEMAAAQGDAEVAVTADTEAAFLVTKTQKPDFKKMQAYADKAIAAKPDDAQANFAEGIALTGQWAQSHDDAQKKKALDALNHADSLAKTAGNEALALSIETFIKNNLAATPAAQ
ncbi:MAG: tetratricopeptide repeat protein [Candidatus Tumulicola sp.]